MQAAASTAPADSIALRPAPPVPAEVPLPGVAVTKLAPPRLRAGLVARPTLERRLADAIVASRLVLLSAPAGFGKTTALARQRALLPAGTATAWISADPDDDLASLLAALLAALAPLGLPWHGAPATLLAAQGSQPTQRPVLAWALQNALAAAPVPRGVIVIDDAHRIADPAAFAFLDALLERLPSHWSLLLASRQAPPLALARLRALGELAELQPAELQFSPAETQALARIRAPGWPDAAVQHLHERTQGWPAGISLALAQAPSVRAHEPAGPLPVPGRIPECGARSYTSDRAVFDYLYSEVLAGLPAALRDFLLRCAALSEWSTDACAAVSGRHDAARWLDDIERRGLFVTGAGQDAFGAPVLRPHAVFLDGLRAAGQRECAADWPALQQRASHWERARPAAAAAAVSVPAPVQAPAPAPIFPAASPAPAAPPAPASAAGMLSAREREVLARIASGDSNKLIARAFDLSPHTVKRHVANILDKLVLSSRVQAAAWHQAQKAHHHQPARQREMA